MLRKDRCVRVFQSWRITGTILVCALRPQVIQCVVGDSWGARIRSFTTFPRQRIKTTLFLVCIRKYSCVRGVQSLRITSTMLVCALRPQVIQCVVGDSLGAQFVVSNHVHNRAPRIQHVSYVFARTGALEQVEACGSLAQSWFVHSGRGRYTV